MGEAQAPRHIRNLVFLLFLHPNSNQTEDGIPIPGACVTIHASVGGLGDGAE